jgi:hypothetical protein
MNFIVNLDFLFKILFLILIQNKIPKKKLLQI